MVIARMKGGRHADKTRSGDYTKVAARDVEASRCSRSATYAHICCQLAPFEALSIERHTAQTRNPRASAIAINRDRRWGHGSREFVRCKKNHLKLEKWAF